MSIEFSIVVPTWNRPRLLEGCLRSLERVEYPRNAFEVIVVDDGSPAPLDSVVEEFCERLPARLLRQENAGPAAARNLGAREAVGCYLVFTDDDCRPATDWLATLAARIQESPDCLISGRRVNLVKDDLFAEASQALTDVLYEHFNQSADGAMFVSTSNLAVPAEGFRALGGFDERFRTAEDRDFGRRWRESEMGVVDAPKLVVGHAHRFTLGSYWRRYFATGRGARQYARAAGAQRSREGGPDLGFYAKLIRHPFGEWRFWRAVRIAGLVGLAQKANAAGYLWEALSERQQ